MYGEIELKRSAECTDLSDAKGDKFTNSGNWYFARLTFGCLKDTPELSANVAKQRFEEYLGDKCIHWTGVDEIGSETQKAHTHYLWLLNADSKPAAVKKYIQRLADPSGAVGNGWYSLKISKNPRGHELYMFKGGGPTVPPLSWRGSHSIDVASKHSEYWSDGNRRNRPRDKSKSRAIGTVERARLRAESNIRNGNTTGDVNTSWEYMTRAFNEELKGVPVWKEPYKRHLLALATSLGAATQFTACNIFKKWSQEAMEGR